MFHDLPHPRTRMCDFGVAPQLQTAGECAESQVNLPQKGERDLHICG